MYLEHPFEMPFESTILSKLFKWTQTSHQVCHKTFVMNACKHIFCCKGVQSYSVALGIGGRGEETLTWSWSRIWMYYLADKNTQNKYTQTLLDKTFAEIEMILSIIFWFCCYFSSSRIIYNLRGSPPTHTPKGTSLTM